MVIETKYDYIYYTVLTQDWFDEAERILNCELTTERIVNAINRKLRRSNDSSINCFKVDYSQHSENIKYWIHKNVQHKEQPVFVQIENNQPIIRSGEGTLFVFYEPPPADGVIGTTNPDGNYWGSLDGLAGAGGRL